MIALFIIGVVCLAISYPLMQMLEKRGSRWSNMALALCIIVGIVCIGVFAFID